MTDIPGRCRVESVEDRLRVGAQDRGQVGVELTAAAPPRERDGRRDPAEAVRDLDVLGDLRESGGHRHGFPLEPGPASRGRPTCSYDAPTAA